MRKKLALFLVWLMMCFSVVLMVHRALAQAVLPAPRLHVSVVVESICIWLLLISCRIVPFVQLMQQFLLCIDLNSSIFSPSRNQHALRPNREQYTSEVDHSLSTSSSSLSSVFSFSCWKRGLRTRLPTTIFCTSIPSTSCMEQW